MTKYKREKGTYTQHIHRIDTSVALLEQSNCGLDIPFTDDIDD